MNEPSKSFENKQNTNKVNTKQRTQRWLDCSPFVASLFCFLVLSNNIGLLQLAISRLCLCLCLSDLERLLSIVLCININAQLLSIIANSSSSGEKGSSGRGLFVWRAGSSGPKSNCNENWVQRVV